MEAISSYVKNKSLVDNKPALVFNSIQVVFIAVDIAIRIIVLLHMIKTIKANLSHTDIFYKKLQELLIESKICEAENLLYAEYEKNNQEYLKLAVDFYQTINQMSDSELEAHNFTRQEIVEGLNDFMGRYGMSLPGV